MKHWIGVVSHDHVRAAVSEGICQFNHGSETAARRLTRGDQLIFYSPRTGMGEGQVLKSFTALGTIADDAPFQVQQTETFHPFRRSVRYVETTEVPIQPLLDKLSFSKGKKSWGVVLRRGLFEITESDYQIIALAMRFE